MLQSSANLTISGHFSCSRLFEINTFIQIEGCRKHLDLEIPTQKLACKGKIMKIYYNKVRERKRPRCLFTGICLVPKDISLSLSMKICALHWLVTRISRLHLCEKRRSVWGGGCSYHDTVWLSPCGQLTSTDTLLMLTCSCYKPPKTPFISGVSPLRNHGHFSRSREHNFIVLTLAITDIDQHLGNIKFELSQIIRYRFSSFSVRLCLRTFNESISVFFLLRKGIPTLLINLVFFETKYYSNTTYVAFSEQPKLADVFIK